MDGIAAWNAALQNWEHDLLQKSAAWLLNSFQPFRAWKNAIASLLDLDPFWLAVVVLFSGMVAFQITYVSCYLTYKFMRNVLTRRGSFPRNLALLAVFSVPIPLLVALGITAVFAPNVHTVNDFAAAWAQVAGGVVPVSLLFEATFIALAVKNRRNAPQAPA